MQHIASYDYLLFSIAFVNTCHNRALVLVCWKLLHINSVAATTMMLIIYSSNVYLVFSRSQENSLFYLPLLNLESNTTFNVFPLTLDIYGNVKCFDSLCLLLL